MPEKRVKLEDLERELKELALTIRRACMEMEELLAEGRMETDAVDEQFRWIWHLKRRRECILSEIGRRRSRKADNGKDEGHVDR